MEATRSKAEFKCMSGGRQLLVCTALIRLSLTSDSLYGVEQSHAIEEYTSAPLDSCLLSGVTSRPLPDAKKIRSRSLLPATASKST